MKAVKSAITQAGQIVGQSVFRCGRLSSFRILVLALHPFWGLKECDWAKLVAGWRCGGLVLPGLSVRLMASICGKHKYFCSVCNCCQTAVFTQWGHVELEEELGGAVLAAWLVGACGWERLETRICCCVTGFCQSSLFWVLGVVGSWGPETRKGHRTWKELCRYRAGFSKPSQNLGCLCPENHTAPSFCRTPPLEELLFNDKLNLLKIYDLNSLCSTARFFFLTREEFVTGLHLGAHQWVPSPWAEPCCSQKAATRRDGPWSWSSMWHHRDCVV